eukprot:109237-Pleurochrysis_carterae.AAC.2
MNETNKEPAPLKAIRQRDLSSVRGPIHKLKCWTLKPHEGLGEPKRARRGHARSQEASGQLSGLGAGRIRAPAAR